MNMTYNTKRKTRLSESRGLTQASENDTSTQYDGIPNSMLNSVLTERMTGLESRRVDIGKSMHQKIESHYGVSMPGLKVYKDEGLNEAGAYGYAKGNEIHIAAENMNLQSQAGQSLLLHEAGHVVQQGAGLASGSGFLYDNALESSADMGFAAPQNFAMPTSSAGPVQGGLMDWLKKLFSKGGSKSNKQTIPQTIPQTVPEPIPEPIKPPAKTLQEERDYLFANSGGYRTNAGDAKNIPIIAGSGKAAISKLHGSFSGMDREMSEEDITNSTNQYMAKITDQLDTPEMSDFLGSLGNTMGGAQYDDLLKSGNVPDVSTQLMSQLPTRGFSVMNAMSNEETMNTRLRNNMLAVNTLFGSMHVAYNEMDKETGQLPEKYKKFAPLMKNYEVLRSGVLSKALPNLRDETLGKLTSDELAIARPGGITTTPQSNDVTTTPEIDISTTPQIDITTTPQIDDVLPISQNNDVAPIPQINDAPPTPQSDVHRKFNERNSLTSKLTTDFIKMHNVKKGETANGIDPRVVADIMQTVSGGKGMEGDELQEFMQNLGGSDMEKKKPILDIFFKNMSDDILSFDDQMLDDDYIENNLEKVQDFVGHGQAYDTMKKQQSRGYEIDEEQNKNIKKAQDFSGRYATYVQFMLAGKHGLSQDHKFKGVPPEILKELKDSLPGYYKDIKELQNRSDEPEVPVTPVASPQPVSRPKATPKEQPKKKPFWKFWGK
ncbi:MAG: DUF4157 domain-containing protein [Oscillospiraceae bacterium]|jgi:hypothetical protein|nr:DUF4157 domain-containing protein [Oscillospiraceae bacterium]